MILDKSIDKKDSLNIALANKNIGSYFLKKNLIDSAFYYFNKAERFYIAINDIENVAKVKVKKAQIQYYKNDFLASELSVIKVLRHFENSKNFKLLNACYSIIGLSKIEMNEIDEGIKNLNNALIYARNFEKNENFLYFEKNNLGLAYLKKKDYSNALIYFNQLLNSNLKEIDIKAYLNARHYIAYCKFKLGDTKDFEKTFLDVIREREKINNYGVIPKIQLSEYYKSINLKNEAQKYALDAFNSSNKEKAYRDKLLALKQLSDVFPEKAKFYLDEYVKLKDSIADVDKKTSNTFARIEYRVDELNDKNIDLERRNKNIILYSLFIGFLGLMIYFYNWRKSKLREMELIQQNNEANEKVYQLILDEQLHVENVIQEEQKRISRDIHDAVLGRIFGIRLNLDLLNTKIEKEHVEKRKSYIIELQEIENGLRQISHQLNDEKKEIMSNFKMMFDKLVIQQENLQISEINYKILNEIPWGKITDEQKINLYRIIQESFQNINKYANAKNVNFELSYDETFFKISIKDDGVGFNTKKKSKGIGLKNMKERAALIGATYQIESKINEGTQTTIILNLETTKNKKNENT